MRSIFTPREPFTSSKSPGSIVSATKPCGFFRRIAKKRARSRGKPAVDGAVDNLRRVALHGDHPIEFQRGGLLARFAMQSRRLRTQFQHFAGGQNSRGR